MTTEEKFQAAVNVVRNLPKDGPFKPSTDLQLKFYSYYKQATEGPCVIGKPNFWDLIARAKWDAWKKVGTISKEEAKECYVNEMIKIVEEMAYSESVIKFMNVLGLGGLIPVEDIRKTVFSNPKKLDSEDDKEMNSDIEDYNEYYESLTSEYNSALSEEHFVEEHFCKQSNENETKKNISGESSEENIHSNSKTYNETESSTLEQCVNVNEELTLAIRKLQHNVIDVKKRLNTLELQLNKIPHPKEIKTTKFTMTSFNNLSPSAKVLIILWPFLAQWFLILLNRQRKFFIRNLLILLQYLMELW